MSNVYSPISRLFYQFLLSHVLIFAIPFIILTGVVYYNAVVRFKFEIEASNVYKLNQVKNTFDLLARGLDNTASRISIDCTDSIRSEEREL